jgi:outer membrane protein
MSSPAYNKALRNISEWIKKTKNKKMKKQLKLVVLALMLSLTAFTVSAQSAFKKADKMLEGTVSLTKATDVKATWTLNPTVGYFVTNRVAVGLFGELGETADVKTTNVGVFARCYFMNIGQHAHVFSQLGVASNSSTDAGVKTTSTTAGLGLGANYFVSPKLALSMKLADLVSYTNSDSRSTLTVGFDGVSNPFTTGSFGVLYKF